MTDPMTPERLNAAILRIHENYQRGSAAAAGDVIALIQYAQAAEAEIGRLRAQVAAVEALRTDLRSPSEGDSDFHDDPVACVLEVLDRALASGDEVQP